MKILIVTAWYFPFIHPRAHRWTALAEHWAAQGYDIHVVTARQRDYPEHTDLKGVQVHRTGFDSLKEVFYYCTKSEKARGRVGAAVVPPGTMLKVLNWLYTTFWKTIYFPDDAAIWYYPARRKVFQLLENQSFDAIITVSFPFTGHLVGLAVKRRFPQLRWLADIGDPFAIQPMPPNNAWLYGRKNRRLEQTVLTIADVVTVTTRFTREKYAQAFGISATSNIQVIPPLIAGYAIPQNADRLTQKPGPAALRIGYFGALYQPTRTPDTFLHLLNRLSGLRPELRKRLDIHFYGEIFPEFFTRLQAADGLRLHGLCSRAEVQRAIQDMDILLNIGNTTDFQLPSKAVDYLASGKPVLNLSYVENDPFTAFFGEDTQLFNLKVRNGKVEDTALSDLIVWLEATKIAPSEEARRARIAPFTVGKIADDYRVLLESSTARINSR